MDRLNIATRGFRGTNKSWRFLQECFRNPLIAIGLLLGDKTILQGVEVSPNGETVSNGFICVNGEVLPFQGGPASANVTIIESVELSTYNTDINNDQQLDPHPTYYTRYAKCGTDGVVTFPFSALTRLSSIKQLSSNIVFTQAMLDKLNGIEEGAEVNEQANWNEMSPSANSFIMNKPFNTLNVTSGTIIPANLASGWVQDDETVNYYHMYPPYGYNINNLAGFIPSLAFIAFSGDVNQDDRFWCKWRRDYNNNRIVIWGNASEHSQTPRINYLAIWIK